MPIYSFKCKTCRRTIEEMHPVTAIPDKVKCPCGKFAKKVYSKFAVLADGDPKWLESAKANLPKDAERIETRGEWRRYLKDRHLECVG